MNLLKHLSIYTFVGFLGGLLGLILMPILTHYLSPSDYGILALFNTYVLITIPIIGVSANGLVLVEMYNKAITKKKFASLFSSINFIPIIPFSIALTLTLIFKDQIGNILDLPANYIFLIPILALLTIFSEGLFSFLVFTKKILDFSVSKISKMITEVLLTLLFVIAIGMHWEGRILSWLITLIGILLFATYYYNSLKLLTYKIKIKYIKSGLVYGMPLILHALGKFVINQSDRIFIAKMVSLEDVGIYNTSYMLGSVLLIISGAFINVYTPYLFERLSDITYKRKIEIVRLSYLFILGLIAVLGILTFFAPFLYKYLINPNYSGGVVYVFWIGLAYLFWGGYLVFAGFLFYKKKTNMLGGLAILNVLLNLGFNYILILNYGTIGAAYATVLSFFVVLILVAVSSQKVFPMPWFRLKAILFGVHEKDFRIDE